MDDILLLYTTWPDPDTAERAAATVIEENLAACANLLGPGVSIFHWEGQLQRAAEAVMILKTTRTVAPALRDRIVELHPYDTPAVVALPVETQASEAGFVEWVCGETRRLR